MAEFTIDVENGKSAYEVAVDNGFTGTVEEWQATLIGNGVASGVVDYQVGTSGEIIPTGEWSSSVVAVPQGQCLWTRTITNYTDGTSTVSYSVARQGIDGAFDPSNVYDGLDSDRTDMALSANMGRELESNISNLDTVKANVNSIKLYKIKVSSVIHATPNTYFSATIYGNAFGDMYDIINAKPCLWYATIEPYYAYTEASISSVNYIPLGFTKQTSAPNNGAVISFRGTSFSTQDLNVTFYIFLDTTIADLISSTQVMDEQNVEINIGELETATNGEIL